MSMLLLEFYCSFISENDGVNLCTQSGHSTHSLRHLDTDGTSVLLSSPCLSGGVGLLPAACYKCHYPDIGSLSAGPRPMSES